MPHYRNAAGDYVTEKQIMGNVRFDKNSQKPYVLTVFGVSYGMGLDSIYYRQEYSTKQACWDYIARNYPNQIFYWNV